MKKYFANKFDSFKNAFNGLQQAFYLESNLFIHFLIALFTIIFAFILQFSKLEWLILLLNIALVICAELLNTSIEKLCDLYSTQKNEKIKIIKDVAASAVLFTAIIALISGVLLFLPKFLTNIYLLFF